MTLHLVKLCVGIESVEQLITFRAQQNGASSAHVTRMTPKRGSELLDGGSLYWVIKGHIQARQQILPLDPVEGADGISRCAIVLSP